MLKRLYEWVLSWPTALTLAPLYLLWPLPRSFFPIPPDVLLLAMAMGAPEKAIRFACICTAGSVLGAIAGYALGWGLWGVMDQWFYHYVPGFSEAVFIQLSQSFSDNAFVALFTAGFTPIPFKILYYCRRRRSSAINTIYFHSYFKQRLTLWITGIINSSVWRGLRNGSIVTLIF